MQRNCLLDHIYRHAAHSGRTPAASSNIVYVSIDDGTYQSFNNNSLDRGYLARVNEMLAEVGAQAVAYDIIFAYPSVPAADEDFAESLRDAGMIYLPDGYKLSLHKSTLTEDAGNRSDRADDESPKLLIERGKARPLYAVRSLEQLDLFADAAYNSGHISALPEPDGVFRRQIMLIKRQGRYIPTLSLAMFLDDIDVALDRIEVEWGRRIRIPAAQSSYLDDDVFIPIDAHGQGLHSFPGILGAGF
ncbi:MAG: CHASE2 domain-containing protein [bacterium]|nr:CHASE2 domain-containing protein [bacterium]